MSAKNLTIVMSVKPCWVDLILSGRKTVELRRRFTKPAEERVTALLYSTRPVSALVGVVAIDRSVILPPASLWPLVHESACVTEDQYRAYFAGSTEAVALYISEPVKLPTAFPLDWLREALGFAPPMSWRSAKPEELALAGVVV